MSSTKSKGDFDMFRATLNKLERLIGVCTSHWTHHVNYTLEQSLSKRMQTTYGDAMIHTLKLLVDLNINTSESNAIEELKRLATMSQKLLDKRGLEMHRDKKNPRLNVRGLLNKLIGSKKAFLTNGTFSRLVSEGGVEPMTALERFLWVQKKDGTIDMGDLLISRVKEAVYTCEAKPSTQSTTVSSTNIVADPVYASQKQEMPNQNLPSECKEPKTTAKSASSLSSWLEDQIKVNMQWLQDQNKFHEEWLQNHTETQTQCLRDENQANVKWIQEQIEAQTKRGVDSRLKDENKVHMLLAQDQNKVNMQWLREQMEAHTKGDVDSSDEGGEELTPTSTITRD